MGTAKTPTPTRKRPAAGQRGQSIVEFALVSLTLLMLSFGIIDFGRAVLTRTMLTNALREAVRYGTVGDDRRTLGTIPDGTTCTGTTYCASIVAAAQQRSPSLGLDPSHFFTSGTPMIGCAPWPEDPATVDGPSWNSSNDGNLMACTESVETGEGNGDNRLTVCIRYPFGFTAPRLIGIKTITMRECVRSSLR